MDFKDFDLIYKENRCEIKDKQKIELKLKEIVGNKGISTSDIDILAIGDHDTLELQRQISFIQKKN